MMVVTPIISAHICFETTGSTLDLGFVIVSLSSLGEVQGAIASKTTTLHRHLVWVALSHGLAGPAVVTHLVTAKVPPGGIPVHCLD